VRVEEEGHEEEIINEMGDIDEPLGMLAERQAGMEWRHWIREYHTF